MGMPEVYGTTDEKEPGAPIHLALDAMVNLLDIADGSGLLKSEEPVGTAVVTKTWLTTTLIANRGDFMD